MQQQSNPVHIVGPIGSLCDGYASFTRGLVKALYKYNYPVKVTSAEPGVANQVIVSIDPELISIIKTTKDLSDPNVLINCTIPPLYKKGSGINIGMTTWETSVLPSDWIHVMNQQDAIFVPSNELIKVYKSSGVTVPIYCIKYPIDKSLFNSINKVDIEPNITRKVTYLFSGNWIPRKNIEDLIFAYCQAFDNVQDVSLVMKTWATGNEFGSRMHIDNAVRHLCNKMNGVNRPRIHVCTDPLEDIDVSKIIKGCDVYVSTSRGEGANIGASIALAMDKYVIADTFLGHADYAKYPGFIPVKYSLRPVIDSGVQFHSSKMRWSSPDFESLVEAFRTSYMMISNKQFVSNNYDITDKIVVDNFSKIIDEIVAKHESKKKVLVGR